MGDNITKIKRTSQSIDNLSFDEGLLVKVVEIIGADGVLKNPAVESPLDKYQPAGMDVSGSPMYFGYIALDGEWYIKNLDTTSGTTYCKGSSDYATAWSGRGELDYDLFNVIFG